MQEEKHEQPVNNTILQRKKTWSTRYDSYKSCCGDIDKECFDFSVRMLFILIVLIFAMIQTMIVEDRNEHQIYLSIVTSILGYMIPSPTFKSFQKK